MILKVQNLSVAYPGGTPLFRDVNLELPRGQRLIVFGSNGCGKSTFLKSLLDSRLRHAGSVQWAVKPHEILQVTQGRGFHDQSPDYVEDYLLKSRSLLTPFQFRHAELRQEIASLLKRLQLPNLPLQILSGGQRQKLKIARAFLNKASVFLLDEPLNAVDSASKKEILEILEELSPQTLQIWVLHDFFEMQKVQAPVLWIQNPRAEVWSFQSWLKRIDQDFHLWMKTPLQQKEGPWNRV
ncbi:MAG: ATP-binding cassette domain-containing protein [Bdellovibrionales bacterium]